MRQFPAKLEDAEAMLAEAKTMLPRVIVNNDKEAEADVRWVLDFMPRHILAMKQSNTHADLFEGIDLDFDL